jgi:hypothetical protein
MMAVVAVTAFIWETAFHVITAILMVYVAGWTMQLTIGCMVGAWKMRQATRRDWHTMLLKLQQELGPHESDVAHIVILPNYNEDEKMMKQTLENIARSPMASDNIRVVLAMEAREGKKGQLKAERLIEETKHLFADICAAYHPKNLPGEVAGKSSNTQWGYRQALRIYAPLLNKLDASRIFLTVGDADTLWHPQFFSAMAYQGLTMSHEERAWTVWQPPVLLLRNLWSVPGPTRVSAYGTFMFELSGLAFQTFGSHLAYSAYSLTLALASHPDVSGWDTDVIAEDHHMYCKCYFASIWEQVRDQGEYDMGGAEPGVSSKVRLSPVFLPAISYLVESSDGWFASCFARFQQARRHSQGVAELSYVLLQYAQLILHVGFLQLPFRTHWNINAIAWKMITVHLINTVQAFSLVVTTAVVVCRLAYNVLQNGGGSVSMLLSEVISMNPHGVLAFFLGAQSAEGTDKSALMATLSCVPVLGIAVTITMFVVIKDLMEGKYTQVAAVADSQDGTTTQVPADADSKKLVDCGGAGCVGTDGKLGAWQSFILVGFINIDMWTLAEQTIVVFGLIPEVMAAWSLMWHGHRFEYIVAAKPV